MEASGIFLYEWNHSCGSCDAVVRGLQFHS